MTDTLRAALADLEAVLCDPEGKACIIGSPADLDVVDGALNALRAALAEPAAQQAPDGWLFVQKKPGRTAAFCSIDDSGSEGGPWDGWKSVTRQALVADGPLQTLWPRAAPPQPIAEPPMPTEYQAASRTAAPATIPAGLLERIKAAEQRIHDGHAPRRIPADPTDVDLVLAEVRLWIESKPPPFWLAAAQQEQKP